MAAADARATAPRRTRRCAVYGMILPSAECHLPGTVVQTGIPIAGSRHQPAAAVYVSNPGRLPLELDLFGNQAIVLILQRALVDFGAMGGVSALVSAHRQQPRTVPIEIHPAIARGGLGIGQLAGLGDAAAVVVGELEIVNVVPDEGIEEVVAGDSQRDVFAGQRLDGNRIRVGVVGQAHHGTAEKFVRVRGGGAARVAAGAGPGDAGIAVVVAENDLALGANVLLE